MHGVMRRDEASAPLFRREETAMAGLYFEEFSVGQEFRHPPTRTVTDEIVGRCRRMAMMHKRPV